MTVEFRRNAVVAVLLVCALGLSWVVSSWLARRVITDMYLGTSWSVLNDVLENRGIRPLDYYLTAVDRIVIVVHFLLALLAVLAMAWTLRSPWVYLVVLLVGDVVLGVMSERYGGIYSIRIDGGLPEFFQYVKEILTCVFCIRLWGHTRESLYAGFAGLFGFLFLDDSLKYHERVGKMIAEYIDLSWASQLLGVRALDIGEMISVVPPAAIFGLILVIGYVRASDETQRIGRLFILGVAALGFFGVFVDLLDRMLEESRYVLSFFEDFGEMLVMTGLTVFAASVLWRSTGPSGRTRGVILAHGG